VTAALTKTLKGLYLILDTAWSEKRSLVDVVQVTAQHGLRMVQYRNKKGSMREAYREALQLRQVAGDHQVLFLVNDRCDLALAVDADGVHLGQSDLSLNLARRLMGPDRLIGISTHRAEEVIEATAGGADYIGFGPMYPTKTKPDHERVVGIEGLKKARSLTHLPIFAIGGITPDSVKELLMAGASGVAVASAVLDAPDCEASVRTFMKSLR